jgi:hypothetical protein
MDNAETNVIQPDVDKPQNKIIKYVIIAAVILLAIWAAKKFIFKS